MRVIIVGGGKTVYFLARTFLSEGYDTTIINRDSVECLALSRQLKATVLCGEGSDPTVLDEAGARRADTLVAVTHNDQDNLVACQTAREMYEVPRTVALVSDPENEKIFQKLGVTVAFCSTKIIANLIEQQTDFEDVKNLLPVAEGRLNVTEIVLSAESPAVGQTLRDLVLPEGSLVGAIFRNGGVTIPKGSSRLEASDRLILMTLPDNHGDAVRALTGERP